MHQTSLPPFSVVVNANVNLAGFVAFFVAQ